MAMRTVKLDTKDMEALLELPLPEYLKKKFEKELKPKHNRSGKSKGAGTQKECADWIAEIVGVDWDNQDDNSPIQTRSMGLAGKDIILRGKVYKDFPYDDEVKAVENLSVGATIKQAESNTDKGRDWLIYWKKKEFSQPIIIVSRSAFGRIMSTIVDYINQ